MKKLFILLALASAFCWEPFHSSATAATRDQKISIYIGTGGKPLPRPRSITQESIDAMLDGETGLLYIAFNEQFGKVNISVKNSMGLTVGAYNCDTAVESMAVINVPTTEDSYTISILGNDVEAYGYYDIQ